MIEPAVKKGLLVAFIGALLLSFDTLLLRLLSADPFQIAFWRGALIFSVGLCVFLILRVRGNTRLSLINGWIGLTVAAFYGFASICFVTSAMMTSIANMLVIIATAPLWAAIGAMVFLKERTPARTWWASIIALLGIVCVVWSDLSGGVNAGDVIALLTAWSMAGAFVFSRRTCANLALAPAMGGLLSAIALAPFVREFTFSQPNQILLMIVEAAMLVPLALGLIAIAPRYLPAPQVGLFLLFETVLGPLWIWAFLGEAPSIYALIGGSVVILTLLVHSGLSLRASKKGADCAERAVSLPASQIAHR